eukprot:CAMPEP_0198319200 /NCGR_PEP_ID=MMETSP1450-20131203/8384_1 /TAXON_ID=753684 ORGANISM="Madagascaria erythrocladiodes, Strain CCMP3234" /NCGR_SAMPLE_ID=MMETSP1450 /ASSEMBLY_ACC=CAM_ASM_001115 /LENGTH=489 /DNA_ID=CAMNT_0044022557 /DNA_START=66 /DNA_END=1532 /DNA_ORIENTATION=-
MEALLSNLDKQVKAEVKKEKAAEEAAAVATVDDGGAAAAADDDGGAAAGGESSDDDDADDARRQMISDLLGKGFNVIDVDELVGRIDENDSLLTSINLNAHITLDENNKKQPPTSDTAVRVARALASNTTVKTLDMASCALDNAAAIAVAEMLQTNNTLEKVNMDSNDIHGETIAEVVKKVAASSNNSLTELKMANQKRSLHSAVETELPKLLEANDTIIKLSVSIKDQTARNALERVLYRNRETARKRRLEAKKKKQAAEGGGVRTDSALKGAKCAVCNDVVFAAERLVVDGGGGGGGADSATADVTVLHKKCFRCKKCRKILTLGTYAAIDNKYYCKPHYSQLFKSAGGTYDTLGSGVRKGSGSSNTNSAVAAKFKSTAEMCTVCDKRVFVTEKVTLDLGGGSGNTAIVHKLCLKCKECSTKLSEATFVAVGKSLFCKRHAKEASEAAIKEKQQEFGGATSMYTDVIAHRASQSKASGGGGGGGDGG